VLWNFDEISILSRMVVFCVSFCSTTTEAGALLRNFEEISTLSRTVVFCVSFCSTTSEAGAALWNFAWISILTGKFWFCVSFYTRTKQITEQKRLASTVTIRVLVSRSKRQRKSDS